jgi:hypothetical protein
MSILGKRCILKGKGRDVKEDAPKAWIGLLARDADVYAGRANSSLASAA